MLRCFKIIEYRSFTDFFRFEYFSELLDALIPWLKQAVFFSPIYARSKHKKLLCLNLK